MDFKESDKVFIRGVLHRKLMRPSQVGGFLSIWYEPAVYDYRTAFSLEEAQKLWKDGFHVVDPGFLGALMAVSLYEDLKSLSLRKNEQG